MLKAVPRIARAGLACLIVIFLFVFSGCASSEKMRICVPPDDTPASLLESATPSFCYSIGSKPFQYSCETLIDSSASLMVVLHLHRNDSPEDTIGPILCRRNYVQNMWQEISWPTAQFDFLVHHGNWKPVSLKRLWVNSKQSRWKTIWAAEDSLPAKKKEITFSIPAN